MKRLMIVVGLFLPLSAFATGGDMNLNQHMRAMGYLIDEVWAKSGDPRNYTEMAAKIRDLRGHLVRAVAHVPVKVEAMRQPTEKALAVIEYHQYMARVIHLTAALEKTLLLPDIQPESQSREQDVFNLLRQIQKIVGQAHGRFRD